MNGNSSIYKYCSLDVAEIIISSQLLKFSNPMSFNDPFDCDIELLEFDFSECDDENFNEIEQIKNKITKDKHIEADFLNKILTESKIEKIYKKSQVNKIYNSSICCFSLNFKNTCMWSHYGDNHKGVCLVFELPSNSPFISIPSITRGPVNYDKYEKLNYLKSKVEGVSHLFLTKSRDWKYEEEYRFIAQKKAGYYKFKKQFLKGIIFGLNVSDEQIEKIMNISKNCFNENELKFAKFYKDNLQLKYKEI